MTTTLLSTGAYAAARKRRRVEHRAEQRGQPVEHHLRDEQPDEVGRDVLRRDAIGTVRAAEREEVRDQRCAEDRDHREHDEHRHRGAEDRRRGIVVVAFVRVDEEGTRVAVRTPPRISSNTMLGVLFATLYVSASTAPPSAYAVADTRASPVTRESIVPSATPALDRTSFRSESSGLASAVESAGGSALVTRHSAGQGARRAGFGAIGRCGSPTRTRGTPARRW